MATTSTQNHMPRGANGDSRLSRKRAAQQDDKTENPPAKVRKVDHSNHTPRHGHYPTMHPLQRKETRSIQEDEDTGYKASNSENSSSTTGYRYPNTPSTTPSTTPETSPSRGSSWWYRDSEGVHVFKVDDFTGRVRRRTMMDDMYANASAEKMEEYKRRHRRNVHQNAHRASLESEDSDDTEDRDGDSDDDSDDGSDAKNNKDDDDDGSDIDDEEEDKVKSECGDEEDEKDQSEDKKDVIEGEDVTEDEESESEIEVDLEDDDGEDEEGEEDDDYDD